MRATVALYAATRRFPPEERFALTAQIRDAAVSVPSNIAEGHARRGRKDYRRLVNYAKGSVAEVETQLLLAIALKFGRRQELKHLLALYEEIGRMLTTLEQSLGDRRAMPKPLAPSPQPLVPSPSPPAPSPP